MASDSINIQGLDKAELLAALYSRAQVLGLGALNAKAGDLTPDEAAAKHHAGLVEAAAMGSRPSINGRLSTADPTSTAEEVTLQVLAVCLRWRCDGRTRNDGKDDTSSPRAQAAHRHAERLIERSVLRRET